MIEHLLFTHAIQKDEELDVWIHCPACRFRNVPGKVWSERQIVRLLGLVPVVNTGFVWVKGSCCGRQLISRVEPLALAALDADEIETQGLLADRYSLVSILLLIGAFLLFFMPVGCPILLASAWLSGGLSRLWFRVACRVALVLHLVAMNALVIVAFIARK